MKDKILSEEGRRQQAKLKELQAIAERLGCTLPQLAIGKKTTHLPLSLFLSVCPSYPVRPPRCPSFSCVQCVNRVSVECHPTCLSVCLSYRSSCQRQWSGPRFGCPFIVMWCFSLSAEVSQREIVWKTVPTHDRAPLSGSGRVLSTVAA